MENAQKEYDRIFSDIEEADEKLKKYNEELLEKRVGMEKSTGAKQLFDQKISYLMSQIERAEKEGRRLCVAASICGSDLDPQNREKQEETLRNAGALVFGNNGEASLFAALAARESEENKHA